MATIYEVGFHEETGALTWSRLLEIRADDDRMLLTVSMDGTITLADDLTLDEAKGALTELVRQYARPHGEHA